jgi:hypothetical protein
MKNNTEVIPCANEHHINLINTSMVLPFVFWQELHRKCLNKSTDHDQDVAGTRVSILVMGVSGRDRI